MTALAIAEFISATEAIAARASCLLCCGLLSCGPAVLERDRGAWVQRRCSVGRMMCAHTAAIRFAGVSALAIAELSTTEAFAACTSCLLRRGLFMHAALVHERDQDAWMQQRCPAGCMLCAQLPLDSQV